jgi:hypothetical protein
MMSFFRSIYRSWMRFAHVLGWVNSRIMLSVLFIIAIGPVAILRRLYGLFTNISAEKMTWTPRTVRPATIEDLRRIF